MQLDPHAAHIRQLLANQLLIIGDVERADRQMQIAAADAPEDIGVKFWPASMSPTEFKFLGNLETNPLFAPVRDDPRFQAGVQRQRVRLAAVRQEIDRLEMPE